MRTLHSVILMFTLASIAFNGVRGAAWDTLCIHSEGVVQFKTSDTTCCLDEHPAGAEASDPAAVEGWLAALSLGDHHCVDIPLPPVRSERSMAGGTSLAAGAAVAHAVLPALGVMACLPDEASCFVLPADPAPGSTNLSCSTTVLRC